jgi:acetyl-CoA carboxylase biotin carboxyl carrier protein
MKRIEVAAEVAGKVWKIEAQAGAALAADDVILILESMKMAIPVASARAGKLLELRVAEGDAVAEGQVVAVLEG